MNQIQYSTAVRTAKAHATAEVIDTGNGQAQLTLYTGTAPVALQPTTDQVAVVALPIPAPCALAVEGGALTLKPLPETMAVADGTITWGRITNRAGDLVADLSVGIPGSDAALILPVVDIYAGATIRINSANLIEA
jgi:hypothetical protein